MQVLLTRNGIQKLWNESDVEMLKTRGWAEVNTKKPATAAPTGKPSKAEKGDK